MPTFKKEPLQPQQDPKATNNAYVGAGNVQGVQTPVTVPSAIDAQTLANLTQTNTDLIPGTNIDKPAQPAQAPTPAPMSTEVPATPVTQPSGTPSTPSVPTAKKSSKKTTQATTGTTGTPTTPGTLPGLEGIGAGPASPGFSEAGRKAQQERFAIDAVTRAAASKIEQLAGQGMNIDDATKNQVLQETFKSFGVNYNPQDPNAVGNYNNIFGQLNRTIDNNKLGKLSSTAKNLETMALGDIGRQLSDGLMTETDLQVLKNSNPEKYQQALDLKKVYDANKKRNAQVSNNVKDTKAQLTQETQNLTSQQYASKEIKDLNKMTSEDLLGAYDQIVKTPTVQKNLTDISAKDLEIEKLQREKANLRDSIMKEFPTSVPKSVVDAIFYDRAEDLNREIDGKMLEREKLVKDYSNELAMNKEKFDLIKDIVIKNEDKQYKAMMETMDYERRKDLMKFEQGLKASMDGNLDKTVVDGKIVYTDKTSGKIVSFVDPANSASPLNYLKGDGKEAGSCVKYVNDGLELSGAGRIFAGKDQSLQSKINNLSREDNILKGSMQGLPGSVIVMDTGARSADGSVNYGHVGFIQGIDGNGDYIMNSSNFDQKSPNTVSTVIVKKDDPRIKGFYANNQMVGAKQETKLTDKQRTQANQIRTQFQSNPQVKQFEEAVAQGLGLISSLNNPSGPADIASIFGFMKSLDPTSVVREGEFALAQKSAGLVPKTAQRWEQQINGERLTDDQRKDFAKVAKLYMENRAKLYDKAYGDAERILTNQGIDPKNAFFTKTSDLLREVINPQQNTSFTQSVLKGNYFN